jgi:hypothetical protein
VDLKVTACVNQTSDWHKIFFKNSDKKFSICKMKLQHRATMWLWWESALGH